MAPRAISRHLQSLDSSVGFVFLMAGRRGQRRGREGLLTRCLDFTDLSRHVARVMASAYLARIAKAQHVLATRNEQHTCQSRFLEPGLARDDADALR